MSMLARSGAAAALAASLLLPFVATAAPVSDHLQCFKVKDNLAAQKYAATLTPDDPAFAAMPGCQIRTPARLLCVDTAKTDVVPAPPGAPDGEPAQTYLCYKTKCEKGERQYVANDQFGAHTLSVSATGLVCAPVTPACTTASDCPGTDTPCQARSCTAGVCGVQNATAGSPGTPDATGNCRRTECDGSGSEVSQVDDSDVPVDGLGCTADTCTAGTGSNPPLSAGSACAENGGAVCDGSGSCVECVGAGDCTPSGNPCVQAVCSSSTCGTAPQPSGTACTNGSGGQVCDGAGDCVQCVTNSQCSSTPDPCIIGYCTGSNTCGYSIAPDSTPCPGGTCISGFCL